MFGGKQSKATLFFVCYAKTVPLLVLIIFLLFQAMAILFVWSVPARKWIMNQNLHYSFKTEMMRSKVPLAFKTGRVKNWNLSVSSRLNIMRTRHNLNIVKTVVDDSNDSSSTQRWTFYVSQNPIITYSNNKPGLHTSCSHLFYLVFVREKARI